MQKSWKLTSLHLQFCRGTRRQLAHFLDLELQLGCLYCCSEGRWGGPPSAECVSQLSPASMCPDDDEKQRVRGEGRIR